MFSKEMPDYSKRFDELIDRARTITFRQINHRSFADREQSHAWSASALNLLERAFGRDATLTTRFRESLPKGAVSQRDVQSSLGLFIAARDEFSLGFIEGVRREISDEFVVDMCLHSESLLADGHRESAAVLAASALEDCFKRRAEEHGVDTEGKMLSEYINALKSVGILSGATAKLVTAFPKFRNNAMHADWEKITDAEVLSVCAFLKSFATTQ